MSGVTYTLIYVEGYTEEAFYRRCKEHWYRSARTTAFNLEGNFNIMSKILDHATRTAAAYPSEKFSICVCIDRESRYGLAPIDMVALRNELETNTFPDIQLFEAVQDIESWFFHDVETIFEHLRLEKKKRQPGKFVPVEMHNNESMSALFKMAGKKYVKGNKHFIDCLDLKVIREKSETLDRFVSLMEKRAPSR